jgi:hypothetical protein
MMLVAAAAPAARASGKGGAAFMFGVGPGMMFPGGKERERMGRRRRARWCGGGWVGVVLTCGPVAARGDLFAVGGTPATQGYPSLLRYSDAGQALGVFPAVNPPQSEEFGGLTRGPDGALYFYGNILGGGSIVKVTTAGAGSASSVYSVSGGPDNWKLTTPLGLAFDSAGTLYVTSNTVPSGPNPANTTRVYRVDGPNMLAPVYYGTPVTGPSAFLGDVEFDGTGAMYVGIYGVGIRKLESVEVKYTIAGAAARDFKFGPDGKLYVASGAAGVLRYDPSNGSPLGAFVGPGAGGLTDASYLAFGDDGTLYVNDRSATQILKYDALTGASGGTFLDYDPVHASYEGPSSIAYVSVPEPGGIVVCVALVAISGRRARRSRRVRWGRRGGG